MGKKLEHRIGIALMSFDFEKVHHVMCATKWEWLTFTGRRVPEIEDIKQHARDLLEEVWEKGKKKKKKNYKAVVASGGFVAERKGDYLWLQFVVEDECSADA